MRNKLGPKKVERIRKATGLPVVGVHVRGNTDHRKDLLLEGGKIVYLYKDGVMKPSDIRWRSR